MRLVDITMLRQPLQGRQAITLGPEMIAAAGIDQLDINQDVVTGFLHAALEHRPHPQLTIDHPQVVGMTLIFMCRTTRPNGQVAHLRQAGQNFVTHPAHEIGIALVVAEILEGSTASGSIGGAVPNPHGWC